nr:hypothetical protein 20 [bacterium]
MAQSKKDGEKKKKKPARKDRKLRFEPIESIIEALKNCKRLMDERIITLELRYPYKVRFRIDEEKFKALKGWDDEKRDRFRNILSQEVTFGLQSALSGTLFGGFLPGLTSVIQSDEEYKQAKAITQETKKYLVSEEIESLSRLKHSSKNQVIQSLEWEINSKERDRVLGQLEKMRYATVCLWHKQPDAFDTEFSASFLWAFSKDSDQSLTLDLHPYEIKALINDLNKILTALES